MIIALFQPDIPHNAGTLARLARCLGLELHIIKPAGFTLDDKGFRRAGLDYLDEAAVKQHDDWSAFCSFCENEKLRLVLMTTKAAQSYLDFQFSERDVLLFGRESSGAPDFVHEAAQ
ncbi:MAG: TrmH family RNA methyltransferase, partial [Pseudomonadota bacterium]